MNRFLHGRRKNSPMIVFGLSPRCTYSVQSWATAMPVVGVGVEAPPFHDLNYFGSPPHFLKKYFSGFEIFRFYHVTEIVGRPTHSACQKTARQIPAEQPAYFVKMGLDLPREHVGEMTLLRDSYFPPSYLPGSIFGVFPPRYHPVAYRYGVQRSRIREGFHFSLT